MSQPLNITQYISGITNGISKVTGTTGTTGTTGITGITRTAGTTGYTSRNTIMTTEVLKSNIGRILAYVLSIIIILLVILLFVHFFITPIFKFIPGGPGIISVPGYDDGKLFWTTTTSGPILNTSLPIASQVYEYTINLDVFVENPLQFSTNPRIFFSRGASKKDTPSGNTLLGILTNYNIVAALLPDTNDLIVSVLNKDNNMENIVVPNIPIQQPFRLTMVVMEQALEVFINGKLIKTRRFLAPPKDVKGDITATSGIESNAIKVHNLKIWTRVLTVSEVRESTPALSTAKDFGAGPMATSTNCVNSDIDNTMNNVSDRLSKLVA
jgi:hypothetical protein